MATMSSTSSSTSSSMGPIIGKDIDYVYYTGGFSSTTQSKVGLSPFENESFSLHSVGCETDRISEGQFSAVDLHATDDYISFTALADHTASDDCTGLVRSDGLVLVVLLLLLLTM